MGKYELAITDYNQALKIDPNHFRAYNNRGNSYFKQGKDELAIADYSQAIKIDPNDAELYTKRGISYTRQGKYELARTDLEKAKQLFLVKGDAASAKKVDLILRKLP
jgi:tetratricopeptide (TPR) repeat protein